MNSSPTKPMSIKRQRIKDGFTIVELLIVIVVIGILAAITVVGYSGIQDRANDTAVKTDISSIGKAIVMHGIAEGSYPAATQAGLEGVVKPTKSAYYVSAQVSMSYCRSDDSFTLYGKSKSTNAYIYSPSTGLRDVGGGAGGRAVQCEYGGTVYDSSEAIILHGGSSSTIVGWQPWI